MTAASLAPFAMFAVDPFNDGFADKRMEAYLENAGKLYEDASFKEVPGMSGKKCIALAYDNEMEAEFHPVPVSDSKAYILSFRGQWENSETLDNNPTFEAAVDERFIFQIPYIPTVDLVFLDADEKPLKDEILMTMPYGKWREYKHVFFPPEGAAFMRLKIKSGRNPGVFYLDNIKFETLKKIPGETVLNFADIKPESSGSVYGYKLPSSFQTGSNGKSMINAGYGSTTPQIAVDGSGKYRVTFKGEVIRNKGGAVSLALHFIDSSGKKIGEATSNKLDCEPMEFTLPKEAMRIKLSVYNHLLEEIKITKLTP